MKTSFKNWTQYDVEEHYRKVFGRGGERRNIHLETDGLAKAEAAPVAAEAMPEEHSSITCENDQHAELIKWANFNDIELDYSPMDRKQFQGNGRPDFYAMKNRKVVALEMKFGSGKETKAQKEFQCRLRRRGIPTETHWTIREAISFLSKHLLRVDSQGQPFHEGSQAEKHTSISDKPKEQE